MLYNIRDWGGPEMQEICSQMSYKTLKKGEHLFKQGEWGRQAFILMSGKLSMSISTKTSSRLVVTNVGTLLPGDVRMYGVLLTTSSPMFCLALFFVTSLSLLVNWYSPASAVESGVLLLQRTVVWPLWINIYTMSCLGRLARSAIFALSFCCVPQFLMQGKLHIILHGKAHKVLLCR
jgi:CRP-like cAMP-binding protein